MTRLTGLGGVLALLLLPDPALAAPAPHRANVRGADRARLLAMFARAYYPGRSGQIMLVPNEGAFITRRGMEFMHGSPWDYDVRIPLLLWGPGHVRTGVFGAPVAQQDLAPTLARMLGIVLPGSTGRTLGEALVAGAPPPRVVSPPGARRHARRLPRSARRRAPDAEPPETRRAPTSRRHV